MSAPLDPTSYTGCLALETFDRLPAGLLICDLQGHVLRINPRGAAILGCCVGQLMGQPVERVFAPIEDLLALADDPDDNRRGELHFEHRDGQRLLGYSVARGDAAAPVMVLFRDLTEQRVLKAERDRLLRMAMVGEILPSVLHELRNPLAAVTGAMENMVELAGEDDGLKPHQMALHAILHELRRMGLVFQGIGSVGRSLRGRGSAAVDLALEETCRLMSTRADRHRVKLICEVQAMPLLPLDLSVVRAVAFNLVNNAIQACSPGDTVTVQGRLDGDNVLHLAVRDTGRGMTPEIQAQALRPFFTTRANGSGLGLVICKEAVTEAGGSLRIESVPGEGTAIILTIPIDSPKNPQITGAR